MRFNEKIVQPLHHAHTSLNLQLSQQNMAYFVYDVKSQNCDLLRSVHSPTVPLREEELEGESSPTFTACSHAHLKICNFPNKIGPVYDVKRQEIVTC